MDLDALLRQAGAVLASAPGPATTLCNPVVIKDSRRSLTVRCHVEPQVEGVSAVILKQIKGDFARGFSHWASLDFLTGVREAKGIAPRFLGGDVQQGIFLIEDLGEGECLQEILNGDDPAVSREALLALASRMAQLHSATMGREKEFEAIRKSLPESAGQGRDAEAALWLNNRGKLLAWFEAFDGQPPSGFEAASEQIADVYRHPGDFLAFTHGDPAPTNNHFSGERASLIDFEYGCFRHALYDITGWRVLCPLPLDQLREMRNRFREELARTCAIARDEAAFDEAWACLSAYRALAILTWIAPDIIHRNRTWADDWGAREAVFVAVSRLARLSFSNPSLAPLQSAAAILAGSMQKQWPGFADAEALLPKWRSFATDH